MSKRTKPGEGFEPRPRDFFRTFDPKAIEPLKRRGLIPKKSTFCEPCAGDGALVQLLKNELDLIPSKICDIEPQNPTIEKKNVFDLSVDDLAYSTTIITNPPWSRNLLHPIILHLCSIAQHRDIYLLFDADWAYTKQAKEYLPYCRAILPVGRLRFVEGSKHVGFDSVAWYKFSSQKDIFKDALFCY